MEIWNAIKAIKSKAKLAALQLELEAAHIAAAGAKNCGPEMAKANAASAYKVGGIAYLRDVCLSHANGIVHHASVRSHYIPPSPETLAWGGFLGGEQLTWTDAADADAATASVVKKILSAST